MEEHKPALKLIPPLAELRERYAQTAEDLKVLGQLCRIAERAAIEGRERQGIDSRDGRSGQ